MNIESELHKFLKMLSHFQEHFTAYPDQKILGHFFTTQCFSRANPFVNVWEKGILQYCKLNVLGSPNLQ